MGKRSNQYRLGCMDDCNPHVASPRPQPSLEEEGRRGNYAPCWYLVSICSTATADNLLSNVNPSVTVVSIVRLQFLVNLGSSANPTFDQVDVSIWSTVEIDTGIICTCLPSIRLFLIRVFPVLGGSSHKRSGYQNYPDSYGKSDHANSRAKTLVSAVKSQSRPEHNGIELETRYEVRYSDEDEARLVRMQEGHNSKSAHEASARSVNSASEVSL